MHLFHLIIVPLVSHVYQQIPLIRLNFQKNLQLTDILPQSDTFLVQHLILCSGVSFFSEMRHFEWDGGSTKYAISDM